MANHEYSSVAVLEGFTRIRTRMEGFKNLLVTCDMNDYYYDRPSVWEYMLDHLPQDLIAGGYLLVKKTSPNPGATSYAHKTGAGEATT